MRSIKAFSVIKSEKKNSHGCAIIRYADFVATFPDDEADRESSTKYAMRNTLAGVYKMAAHGKTVSYDSKRMVLFLIKEVIIKVWLFLCLSSFRKGCGSCLLITSYVSNEEFAMLPLSVTLKHS